MRKTDRYSFKRMERKTDIPLGMPFIKEKRLGTNEDGTVGFLKHNKGAA